MYQIYPRTFADANGDGVGDLAGIASRLDHLERLGVDGVWLSPFYPSPMDDNGYDITDFCAVDPTFGTVADFDALVDDLHRRGVKVVIDLVANHTSDEHPWFQDALAGGPKRDWYIWRDPRPGRIAGEPGAEPNNWGSFFSGSAWQLDRTSGQYYLHLFSPKQPDLNWENPDVRTAVHEVMRWWLARGVDGFRMDVINLISKDPVMPNGHVPLGETFGRLGRAVVDGPRIHEFLDELRREVLGDRRDILLLGETPASSLAGARRYADPEVGALDMVISFDHMQVDRGVSKWDVQPFEMPTLRRVLARWQTELPPAWNCLYWSNHDQPRVVSRFGDPHFVAESAKALGTVLHLLQGTPFIYQGEELAVTNRAFRSIQDFDDVESISHYDAAISGGDDPEPILAALRAMSRDNARAPMPWEHAGEDDAAEVFDWYQRLIRLRHDEPTVVNGVFALVAPDHPHVFAFTRRSPDGMLSVMANFAAHDVPIPPELEPLTRPEDVVLTSGNVDPGILGPWESRVYRPSV